MKIIKTQIISKESNRRMRSEKLIQKIGLINHLLILMPIMAIVMRSPRKQKISKIFLMYNLKTNMILMNQKLQEIWVFQIWNIWTQKHKVPQFKKKHFTKNTFKTMIQLRNKERESACIKIWQIIHLLNFFSQMKFKIIKS